MKDRDETFAEGAADLGAEAARSPAEDRLEALAGASTERGAELDRSPADDRLEAFAREATELDAEVSRSLEAREVLARDFGGMIERTPAIVVRPRSPEAVAATLRLVARHDLTVSTRARGHSQGGQSLGTAVALDTSGLAGPMELEGGAVQVLAGTTWREVVERVAPHGLLPPVLTDNLHVSVGGTLSAGGLGPFSFRHGPQIAHVRALEVATAQGELVTTSPRERPDLFRVVRGGLGQFGVITRATLELSPAPGALACRYLRFRRLEALLSAMEALADDEATWYLAGQLAPDPGGQLTPHLALASRDAAEVPGAETLMARTMTPLEILEQLERAFPRSPGAAPGVRHPWVEAFVPWSAAADCVDTLLKETAPSLLRSGPILLWPVRRWEDAPMLAWPGGARALLLGVLPRCSRGADLEQVRSAAAGLSEVMERAGGKRYLSGWLERDAEAWARHFGDDWEALRRAKDVWDPDQRLRPAAIPFA